MDEFGAGAFSAKGGLHSTNGVSNSTIVGSIVPPIARPGRVEEGEGVPAPRHKEHDRRSQSATLLRTRRRSPKDRVRARYHGQRARTYRGHKEPSLPIVYDEGTARNIKSGRVSVTAMKVRTYRRLHPYAGLTVVPVDYHASLRPTLAGQRQSASAIRYDVLRARPRPECDGHCPGTGGERDAMNRAGRAYRVQHPFRHSRVQRTPRDAKTQVGAAVTTRTIGTYHSTCTPG